MEAWVAHGRAGCRHVSSYNRYWFREGSGESEVEKIDWSDGSPQKTDFEIRSQITKKIPFGIKLQRGPTLRKQLFNEGTLGILYFL